MNYIDRFGSPLGSITMASDGEALTGLWFDGQKYDRDNLKNTECCERELPIFAETKQWLTIYFGGEIPRFTPRLAPGGSEFRRLIAEIMLTIPYGSVMSYGRIASEAAGRLGKEKMSAQAVGGAVGHNSISLIIPCHRVVGTDGSLTGYAGGIERKIRLLELEGIDLTEAGLYVPKKGTAL